ncbi:MAG: two-component system sensor histidine kinase NtrB [Limisphaerales bacterium]
MSEKRLSVSQWQKFKALPGLLSVRVPPPDRQYARVRLMERDIGIPVKAAIIIVLFHYFFISNYIETVIGSPTRSLPRPPQELIYEKVPAFFLGYILINAGIATLLIGMRHFSLETIQRLVFVNCFLDAFFFAALTVITDGFESFLYWVFLLLILRNTVSIGSAPRQLILNLTVSGAYLLAAIVHYVLKQRHYNMADESLRHDLLLEAPVLWNEPCLLRLSLLILMTVICYGVQVLMEKQRRADEEAREFSLRQEQLQATGRLAAEIAHQLKNPLGIINNAAFTLQRTVKEGKTITQQIRIIREEVDRSDRIITELMGYARLSEGQVEKLNITEELDRAIDQVFPAGAIYDVKVNRDYGAALPQLLAQRGHLSEVFVNILQNAREAMDGKGQIDVKAKYGEDYSIIVTIADNGPGIPADKQDKIFEPYFTTKEKGTGLGLAIVKHNTELYNGTVELESNGQGTLFRVKLPAKTAFTVKK